jgi:F-type H+-transporting ATPase subunit gamma
MPSLRDYRERISSVKSTRKITSAMKMVAASKLRRMQEHEVEARPYATGLAIMLKRVVDNVLVGPSSPPLLIGTGADATHLVVVITADRGLCGGFNAGIVRRARAHLRDLDVQGKVFKILCVGRKGHDALKRVYPDRIVAHYTGITGRSRVSFADVRRITRDILLGFDAGDFDVCSLVYSNFVNLLRQEPEVAQLIPFNFDRMVDTGVNTKATDDAGPGYSFEPDRRGRFEDLLRRNLAVQIFRALLESAAGEQAARMTAMDGATRNAGDMIDKLTLYYNRARQAHITKELIEIISGAEAV